MHIRFWLRLGREQMRDQNKIVPIFPRHLIYETGFSQFKGIAPPTLGSSGTVEFFWELIFTKSLQVSNFERQPKSSRPIFLKLFLLLFFSSFCFNGTSHIFFSLLNLFCYTQAVLNISQQKRHNIFSPLCNYSLGWKLVDLKSLQQPVVPILDKLRRGVK